MIHAHVPQEIILVAAFFDLDGGLDVVDDACLFAQVLVVEKCRLMLFVGQGLLGKRESLLEACLFLVVAGGFVQLTLLVFQ